MHATRLSPARSHKSSRHHAVISQPVTEHTVLPYYFRTIGFPDHATDQPRLWDPAILDRLHAPLTRFHD